MGSQDTGITDFLNPVFRDWEFNPGIAFTSSDVNCVQMTQRLELYAESLTAAVKLDYQPPVVREWKKINVLDMGSSINDVMRRGGGFMISW